MDATADQGLSQGLARVRARFLGELEGRAARVYALRAALDAPATADEALVEIGRIAHKIAGTAATLGFPDLGTAAAAIDEAASRHADPAAPPASALAPEVDRLLNAMQAALRGG